MRTIRNLKQTVYISNKYIFEAYYKKRKEHFPAKMLCLK